jgi:hypothetical protein
VDPDDAETLIECRACGGKWKLADHVCRWCTEGLMSMAQVSYWLAHKSGTRPAVRPGATGGA